MENENIDEIALESQTKMMYLIIPMVDMFVNATIAEGFVKKEASASMVMNIITNLFNLLIVKSFNNGSTKAMLAGFLKESLAALAQHTLNKLKELPDDEAVESKEANEVIETPTTH